MKIRARGILSVNDYSSTWGQDYSNAEKEGGLSYDKMNSFLGEIMYQPPWRARADIEADYYDSNQHTAEELAELQAKGIPPIVVNLIAPTINMVLGLEAKTRRDWLVRLDKNADNAEDLASAMGVKLKEAERMSGADRAISDAYGHQVKVGLGWVEVNYNRMNPFGYQFACNYVHRREIWWDWHDDDPKLKKARYLVRRKWYDVDVAVAYFPQHKERIETLWRGLANFDPTSLNYASAMYIDLAHERDFSWGEEEWKDTIRKRVCLYEVWYRTYERGMIVRYNNGRVTQFDEKNEVMRAAVMAGIAELEPAVIPRMRLSYWMGPHRLMDMETPFPHDDFPYVPFWGFREDRTGAPYGMIRAMRPLQDEVNARRSRMLWQLSAKRVLVDKDAVDDHKKLQQEVARPDAYVKVNTMKGKFGIRDRIAIEDNSALTSQQFDVYQDSKKTLQDAGGIYQEMLGKAGAADSGVAISQLIDQGTTTLAEINDNYALARAQVGNLLLSLVVESMQGKPESIPVTKMGATKKVKFNEPREDKVTGKKYLNNDVARLQMMVVLDEVPQTPTYRMQQFQQITEMVKGMPEQVQMALIDIVINASDMPEKQEALKRIRDMLGIGNKSPEDMNEQELAEFQQKQEQQQVIQQLQQRLQESEAALQEANVSLTRAKTQNTVASTDKIVAETDLIQQEHHMAPVVKGHEMAMSELQVRQKGMQAKKAANKSSQQRA